MGSIPGSGRSPGGGYHTPFQYSCLRLPQAELFVRQRERPGLHSQAVAWPPRLSAGRRDAAAAKSHQSCPTLCDPIDGSPPGCPIPGILQARTLEWAAAERSNPTSKEQWLRGRRRVERSYSTFKVRRGGCEEIPLVQGKEQRLHFAGAAVKRYPTSKVRETQIRQ